MSADSKKRRSRTRSIYFLFSIVVTISIFSYLFQHITPGEVFTLITEADRRGIFMFMALSFLMSYYRALRYHILLRISGYTPSILTLYLIVLVGNFFSDLLPARLGSLIYVFIITTRLGMPFGTAASSFALAFLFDLLSLAPVLLLIAWGVGAGTQIPPGFLLMTGLVVAIPTIVFIAFLPEICRRTAALLERASFLSPIKRMKLSSALEATDKELVRMKAAGVFGQLLTLSIIIRVIKYSAMYMFLFALLHPVGYELGDLNVAKVFLGACASESAASVPFAGVAGFGIYEGAWSLVFQLLGFPGEIAKLTSVSHHLFVQVYGYILGALALLILLLPVFKTKELPQSDQPNREQASVFYGRLALSLILTALCLLALYRL